MYAMIMLAAMASPPETLAKEMVAGRAVARSRTVVRGGGFSRGAVNVNVGRGVAFRSGHNRFAFRHRGFGFNRFAFRSYGYGLGYGVGAYGAGYASAGYADAGYAAGAAVAAVPCASYAAPVAYAAPVVYAAPIVYAAPVYAACYGASYAVGSYGCGGVGFGRGYGGFRGGFRGRW